MSEQSDYNYKERFGGYKNISSAQEWLNKNIDYGTNF